MFFYKSGTDILFSKTELKGLEEIKPNTVDASVEKHVPVYTQNDNNVDVVVGSVLHPMEEVHFIEFIVLETTKGIYQAKLQPQDEPKAHFEIKDEDIVAVYDYCNLHGLWMTK